MRENNNFTGSGNATIIGNSCAYFVNDDGGNSRIINVTSTMKGITRKLQITTNDFNPIAIVSWQNVGDF